MSGVMRKQSSCISCAVHVVFGLALSASAAAAFPLSAAVDEPAVKVAPAPPPGQGFAIIRPGRRLDARSAALESAQIALSRVPDGSTYIWHRRDGSFSGTVKPTVSFRGARGELCRHLVMELSSERDFRVAEGVACREADGIWRLEG
jgi:hypothetical protein